MSVLTDTLHQVFPGIKVWAECDEVTKIRKQAAWIANQKPNNDTVTCRDDVGNVLGINHFSIADAILQDDHDMTPAYQVFVADHAATGWAQADSDDPEKARYFFLLSYPCCL